MEPIDRIASDFWDDVLRSSPTTATMLGDRRFDDQLDDIGPEATAARLAELKKTLEAVKKTTVDGLEAQQQITHSMLLSEAQSQIDLIETGFYYAACDPNTGLISWLLSYATQTVATTPEQAEMLAERYQQLPRLFDQTAERHRTEFAAGRTATAANISRVLSQIDGYLASSIDEDPFINTAIPEDWEGREKWRADLAEMVEQESRPAIAEYRSAVANLLPLGRDDDHPGASHVANGEADYERCIQVFTNLSITPQELHDFGRDEAEGRLADEFRSLGQSALGTSELKEVLDRLRNDPTLRYDNSQEILDDANAHVARSWAVSMDWFNLKPSANCSVVEVPAALAKDSPPAYYFPPAQDGSRPGTYFINTHDAPNRVRYGAEAVGYHEANPGHHFQLTLAAELPDLPEFRKHALTYPFVEGWGLYSERLAEEMGLYTSDLARLGMVSADAWRACRLVVDTGLHAFGWTRQQAVDYLHEWCAIDEPSVQTEVDRYIGMPGQALAYKAGQREIFRLRALAESTLGDRFDIKAFHDVVLGSGNVTLPVLAKLVEDYLRTQGS